MSGSSQVGAVVAGRYRVQELLGRGGMADVHAAHDELLDRRVAIKVLRDTPDSEVARRRFVSEARILAGLSDPGLVTVLDAGISGEHPFLVMELLPGGTVADLTDRGRQPVHLVAEVGAQVASALVAVHAAGVVHRDVKPSNVLLDRLGQARLADFGIARLVGDTVRATTTGTTIGTAGYLAPEQAAGEDVSTAADVYALGLVLIELAGGVPAFTGTPTEAVLARLSQDPVVPADLPAPLADLLAAMTTRDPQARPTASVAAASLREVAQAARAGRAAQVDIVTQAVPLAPPVPLPVGTPISTEDRAGRRTRVAAVVLAAVAALALVVGVGLTRGDEPADTSAGGTVGSADQVAGDPTPTNAATDEAVVPVAAPSPAATTQPRTHAGRASRPHRAAHHPARHHHKPKHHKAKHHGPKHHKPKHHKPKHHKPKHHKPKHH